MDPNTKIILANAPRAENWEDRQKATDEVESLIEEFGKRLPIGKNGPITATKSKDEESKK